jgi:hypothetical protein
MLNQVGMDVSMSTRKVTTEYRLAQWSKVMEARQASGLSIKAYCAQAGISSNTYFYWQEKLRIQASKEMSVVPNGWARLSEAPPSVKSSIVVEINGCRISVDSETDTELLAKVCRTLRGL